MSKDVLSWDVEIVADGGFVAALAGAAVGAVAGGGAALAGSVIVNRREVRRSARLRIHDEHVPALLEEVDERRMPMMSEFWSVLAATRRSAIIAGARAVELTDELAEAHSAWWSLLYSREAESTEEARRDARLVVEDRIEALARWVETKIL